MEETKIKYTKEHVFDYLPEFFKSLEEQLKDDHKRWGDTWKNRPLEGQTERFRATFDNYFDSELYGGEEVNWIKVAGNALIAWIRQQESKNQFNDSV